MGAIATVILTTGSAGSGKTYSRCARFLMDEFLPNENGRIISNYPINREAMAAEVARKSGKDYQAILDRIVIIPREELNKWMLRWERRDSKKAEGPWSFFKDKDIDCCHIAIDEIHNFCGVSTPKHQRQLWGNWLGEIRHRGATVEFLTQSPHKLAKEIVNEASVRISLVNCETKRDPIFGIPLAHWYEILGAFTGGYEKKIDFIEKRVIDGRWVNNHKSSFTLDPYYFQFYDSYAAPHSGGMAKVSKEVHECDKRSKSGILLWFV